MTNSEAIEMIRNDMKLHHDYLSGKYRKALGMAVNALKAQQWIPCSERLPDKYGLYLVTMTEKAKAEDLGFDLDEIDVRRMRYNSNGWLLPRHYPAWINAAVADEVIAWMPLPEPFKAERREE